MSAFDERLKTYAHLQFSEQPFDPVNVPAIDIRGPRLILSHGRACGVASAQVAAVLLAGCESNRMLHAVHGLLAELTEAEPEQIPVRLRELIESFDAITKHLDGALSAIEVAQKEMFDAAPTSATLNQSRRTH